jgi:hypothetical protein
LRLQSAARRAQVPDGYRMVVTAGPGGAPRRSLQPLPLRRPSWTWRYALGPAGALRLTLEDAARRRGGAGGCRPAEPAPAPEPPFCYVI